MSLNEYNEWFDNYTQKLIESSSNEAENYELKVEHTHRVVSNIIQLSELMKLDNANKELGKVIGLFHDLGRFVQFSEFGTFSEAKTGSHATLSVDKLKKENLLHELTERELELVYQAIEYHNHLTMPEEVSERVFELGTILRDADKLDAFYLNTSDESRTYSFDKLSQENLFSEEIIESILSSQQANFRDIKYTYDRDLSIIALLFDLKLDESFKIVHENNYIERMFDVMPNDEKLLEARRHCLEYIQTRLK